MNKKKEKKKVLPRAIGDDHVISLDEYDRNNWVYTVTFQNSSSTIFEEICIFYKPINQDGVVFLNVGETPPGVITTFKLGPCNLVESYAIGLFWRVDGVLYTASIPEEGNIYPPVGTFPCFDSIEISDLPI